MEIRYLSDKKLVEVIESQNSWDTEEMGELLRRADIDPTQAPYVIDGECMVDPEDLYEEAIAKLNIK